MVSFAKVINWPNSSGGKGVLVLPQKGLSHLVKIFYLIKNRNVLKPNSDVSIASVLPAVLRIFTT